ncbi:MAG TPA: surface carbohydrate biosynthesis protein [Kiloniellales bacterium]|nr:surface carbohydrate biosynthesis protein [Kiloniellales bacterium]
MTHAPRIGLVLDHPQRDMTGLLLVALELSRAGASVVILPSYLSWLGAAMTGVDAVMFNFARRGNLQAMHWLARQDKDIFVLDTEGYLSADRHKMLLCALSELNVGNLLQGYFVWGEASKATIAQADPVLGAKIVVSGCPRFDMFAPRWRGMLTWDRRDYILINPNFNSVNPLRRDPEAERQTMRAGGWEPSYLDRFLADMRAGFASFLELCKALPQRMPHRQFVVRPHPFEWAEPYREATAGLPNVHVNTEGEVFPVLANAARLIHLNCNTSVETRMLGGRPIQAGFLNTELLRKHLPLYTGVSVTADSLDELCRMLDDDGYLAAKDDSTGIHERWIQPAFGPCDGYAARRVAEALLARCRPRGQRGIEGTSPRESTRAKAARLLRVGLGGLLGTAAIAELRAWRVPRRRAKQFTAEGIRAALTALATHSGQPAPAVRTLRSPWTAMPMAAVLIE